MTESKKINLFYRKKDGHAQIFDESVTESESGMFLKLMTFPRYCSILHEHYLDKILYAVS